MTAVLAIDQGTTGSTALVLSREGEILGRAYSELTQHYPEPGWVEHDPEEIWQVSRRVMSEAIANAGLGQDELSAIGITNQRETTVIWEDLFHEMFNEPEQDQVRTKVANWLDERFPRV
jgi:glycerol kinase